MTSLGPTGLVQTRRTCLAVPLVGSRVTLLSSGRGLLQWAYNFLRLSMLSVFTPFTVTVAVGSAMELTGVLTIGMLNLQVLIR